MINQQQVALSDAADWLGDWHPLAEQLGSASGLLTLASVTRYLGVPDVTDVPSLRHFLRNYQTEILGPFELPAIYTSQRHVERSELRELIVLDSQIARAPELALFADASGRIGRWQLQKLRPLRDLRIVQRYLAAVESGEAHGWHTIVYGLTLAVYSLPSRQGMVGYAHQVTRGQIHLVARNLGLSERDCREIFEEFSGGFAALVEEVVRGQEKAPVAKE